MTAKPWYTSKTLWFNLLALAVFLAGQFGYAEWTPDPAVSGLLAALGNFGLRLVTRQGIRFG